MLSFPKKEIYVLFLSYIIVDVNSSVSSEHELADLVGNTEGPKCSDFNSENKDDYW